MKEIRITVRCLSSPTQHAKYVRVKARLGKQRAQELADLLDGSSLAYVHPPGPNSPIGRCCQCGGEVECEVSEIVNGKPVEPTAEEIAAHKAHVEKKSAVKLNRDLREMKDRAAPSRASGRDDQRAPRVAARPTAKVAAPSEM